jgi:hypothetical protein
LNLKEGRLAWLTVTTGLDDLPGASREKRLVETEIENKQ